MYQLIEHESGWNMGSRNRPVDEFLTVLAEDFSFEVVSIMRVGPFGKPDYDSRDRHEYQIVIKIDAEFGEEIPREAINKACRDGPSYESNW